MLAIDTALEACAVAVVDAGEILAEETVPMGRGHAEALLPLLARVMDMAAIGFGDLARIAVTVGPGSFTGVRVGIAAARGIALATREPVVGVSTLAAFAAPHFNRPGADPVAAAIDARHGQVYLQVFASGGRTLVAPRAVAIADAVRLARTSAIIVGSGAGLLAEHWPNARSAPRVEQRAAPEIAAIAQLGASADPGLAVPRPLYLRPPDARPQDAARIPRR